MGKRARDQNTLSTARAMKPRADKHKKLAKMEREGRVSLSASEPEISPAKQFSPTGHTGKTEEVGPSEQRPCVVPDCEHLTELDEGRLMSRLLYTNPVCLLTTCIPEAVAKSLDGVRWKRNAMTVSWLSPCNNEGMFTMCVNKKRFSAECLIARKTFALSVPVKGQEQIVLAVGSDCGKKSDKLNGSIPGLTAVKIGSGGVGGGGKKGAGSPEKSVKRRKAEKHNGNPFALLEDEGGGGEEKGEKAEQEGGAGGDAEVMEEMAIAGCCAQIQASVLSHSELDSNHWLVRCQMDRAFVHPKYWNGKHFIPVDVSVPPYLTFLGATRFAYVHA